MDQCLTQLWEKRSGLLVGPPCLNDVLAKVRKEELDIVRYCSIEKKLRSCHVWRLTIAYGTWYALQLVVGITTVTLGVADTFWRIYFCILVFSVFHIFYVWLTAYGFIVLLDQDFEHGLLSVIFHLSWPN